VALNPDLDGRALWVGGGRHGDGIVIAANRAARKFGVQTGMACFEARRLCPAGVLCRPHYDEYRRLSQQMFRIVEEYSPILVPVSIDEGFLDFTAMQSHIWRDTTPAGYVGEMRDRIRSETGLPVSAGLASSSRLAKLATDAGKPGFLEVPAGCEKEFLKDRPVRELSGIATRRERALAALGAKTFGDVARLSTTMLTQKFGIWGQQLWLFANGKWSEPLLLGSKDRTTISSNTTLPYDETDYEGALTFALSETIRLVGQLRRERLQLRQVNVTVRFSDFTEVESRHRFRRPQFVNSIVNSAVESLFREMMSDQAKPIRQIRIALSNLSTLDVQPMLWERTEAERWGSVDDAMHELNGRLGKRALMTGSQLALHSLDDAHKDPKAKCPFVPQREMVKSLWGEELKPMKSGKGMTKSSDVDCESDVPE
jgi:DNA polymerase-4